jgi:hypothetical protein
MAITTNAITNSFKEDLLQWCTRFSVAQVEIHLN